MLNNGQKKGLKSYLERLTHRNHSFDFKFRNIEFDERDSSKTLISYDLFVESKQDDIPFLSEYFQCKSYNIIEVAIELVGANKTDFRWSVEKIYFNNEFIKRYDGYIPYSLENTIKNKIIQEAPKFIHIVFFCGNEKKQMKLYINLDISDIYADSDGFVLDLSLYCYKLTIDDKLIENLNEDIVDTIVGYINEKYEDIRIIADNALWDEITKYMPNLEDCELWGHVYCYLRSIDEFWSDNWNYIPHTVFSDEMCKFLNPED